jgi:hypothetical protein
MSDDGARLRSEEVAPPRGLALFLGLASGLDRIFPAHLYSALINPARGCSAALEES